MKMHNCDYLEMFDELDKLRAENAKLHKIINDILWRQDCIDLMTEQLRETYEQISNHAQMIRIHLLDNK